MHVHRNGSPDSASAVSGGSSGSDISHITIVGNLFYDVDQAATAKQGNFYTFLNNTVVDQNGRDRRTRTISTTSADRTIRIPDFKSACSTLPTTA